MTEIENATVRALAIGPSNSVFGTGGGPGNLTDFLTVKHVVSSAAGHPGISVAPQGSNVLAGATVVMNVGVTGAAPFSFQWRLNGSLLSGATNGTLLLGNIQPLNAGDYSVEISNALGRVTSADARVWVLALTNQPLSQGAAAGSDISFGVGAAGAPLGYRWRFNGTEMSGAMGPVLTLSNVQVTNAGDYDVVVTNWFGALTSQVARLIVYGQVDQEWTADTNGLNVQTPASLVRVVATDKSGNVYVAGLDLGAAGNSMELIQFSGAGNEIWRRAYRGPLIFAGAYATALVLDPAENVIITGIATAPTLIFPPPQQTGYSFYQTLKFSPTGVQQFSSSINAPVGAPDPPALAADAFGNAFVAAKTLVAKLATNGQSLWISNHVLLTSPAITVDPAGDLLLTASVTGTNATSDYVIVKRNSNGIPIWSQTYNGTADGADVGTAIASDAQGNAIVTGVSPGTGTGNDIVTLKYAPNGAMLWSARFDGAAHGSDEGVAVKVNAQGDVFVSGKTTSTNGTKDFVLLKYYGSNGAPAWVRQSNGAGPATDDLAAMALDGAGNICISGTSVSSIQSGFQTLEFDAAGHLLWEAFVPQPGAIGVTGLATHATDAVYLVGYNHPGTGFSIVRPLIKYGVDYLPTGGRFTHYRNSAPQQAEFSAAAIAGNSYALEATTNALPTTNWFVISNFVRTSGQMQFVAPTTNAAARFYRLRFDP